MDEIKITVSQYKKLTSLIKRIRYIQEEWCENINEENLRKINTYKHRSDAYIILEALQCFLWEKEDNLNNLYDNMSCKWEPLEIKPEDKKNDKTN